ncbi:10-epi-junenol synthase, partial [Tanacetum coccineum]
PTWHWSPITSTADTCIQSMQPSENHNGSQNANTLEATHSQDVEGKLSAFPSSFTLFLMDCFPVAEQDVFNKFKDRESGKFKEYITSDVMGILSLYESTQLRISGQLILDEAFVFTQTQLKGVVDTREGNLAKQVKHALHSPF